MTRRGRRLSTGRWIWGVLFLVAGAGPARAQGQSALGREVRSLFADRCFVCHGPGLKKPKAGLRLDDPASLFASRAGGRFIVKPGSLADSELWRRVVASDDGERMPPPDSHLALAAAEVALLRRWIVGGAPYRRHWSFETVKPPAVPRPGGGDAWTRNPIDAFVLDRLRAEKLGPSSEAPREVLIRRLSFDLTGLPPSPEEVAAFVADGAPDAYERLVDRLLTSPHYGERMALDWLDLARFSDTFGYQLDRSRDMSAWRDWVIGAFNQNLPYDQFLLWQVAGDLLPNPTRDQVVATAFNRLHRQTNEGGSIDEEFRTEYVVERVNTLGTAVLGLTLECARCHDHKYDPITQRDYYALFAFFNNVDESGVYSYYTRATPGPTLALYAGTQEARHRALGARVRALEAQRDRAAARARAAFDAVIARGGRPGPPRAPVPVAFYDFDRTDGAMFPEARGGPPAERENGVALVDGRAGRAVRFDGDDQVVCRKVGDFGRTQPFSLSLWLRPAAAQKRAVVVHRSRAWTDAGSRGYELVLDEGRPSLALIHFWPTNAVSVRARHPIAPGRWAHVVATYDGSSRAHGIALYVDGARVETEVIRDQLTRDIRYRADQGDREGDKVHLALGARYRDVGFRGGAVDELGVFDVALTALEARLLAATPDQPVTAPPFEDLFQHQLERHDQTHARQRAELRRARDAENQLTATVAEIMVMKEMRPPRPTFVLGRGRYDAPGERVEPGTPGAVFPYRHVWPRNRLGLGRWLVDRENPLTARVAANRVWKIHFGRGLVATPEDFGAQGARPTHPELLDWLAARLVASGWDRKALHRLIVTSATYRQSSRTTPALRDADPENRLQARGPRRRLDAELIRDHALAASGLLVRTIGGPSVKPYQPAALWEDAGAPARYVPDHGPRLYRRSLYTFHKRTAPPPAMTAFDAPSREVCVARRDQTATPLQALVLLNDPQFVEASRVLAALILRQQRRDPLEIVAAASRRLLGRPPDADETTTLVALWKAERDHFARRPAEARALLAVGESPRPVTLPSAVAAATTVLVSTLMNHDEFVTIR